MMYLNATQGHLVNQAFQATPYQRRELGGRHCRWFSPDP